MLGREDIDIGSKLSASNFAHVFVEFCEDSKYILGVTRPDNQCYVVAYSNDQS